MLKKAGGSDGPAESQLVPNGAPLGMSLYVEGIDAETHVKPDEKSRFERRGLCPRNLLS